MRHPARRTFWTALVLSSVFALVAPAAAQYLPITSVRSASSAIAGTNCTVGSYATHPAYDPANRLIYVPNHYSSNVSVINGTCGVVGSVSLPSGSKPWAAAYNPLNKDVYVTDALNSAVYVIHNLTRVHVIRNSSFTPGILTIAWDPSAKLMLCVNRHGLLVGINGASISGSIHVGRSYSVGMAFDSRANEILVTIYANGSVTGVNASHPFSGPQLTIHVGKFPVGIASDPATGYDYVTNSGAGSVSVINASSGSNGPLGTIPVGSVPEGVAVDPVKHEVFVANLWSNNVSVISGLSVVRTLSSFPSPRQYLSGVVYDPSTKLVYVTAELYKVFIVS